VFVDTGGWLTVIVEADKYHAEGSEYFKRAILHGTKLLTTDYVVDETITRLAYDHGHTTASQFLTDIATSKASGQLDIHRVDESAWFIAEQLFKQYKDVKLSFTDCTSFAVLRQLNLTNVFGYDAHFAMMGFNLNAELA
jgi:predicted nucleic acid-binding protein